MKRKFLLSLTSLCLVVGMLFSVFFAVAVKDNSTTVIADATTQTSPVINSLSTWKYLDDGTDPASSSNRTSWTAVDFDDSGWKSASGKFGAKAGLLQALDSAGVFMPTVLLNHYQADNTCVPTYFFRCEFELKGAPPADGLAIVGTLRYDDAAIVYINGTRVAAFDEPEGGFESNLSYGGSGAYDPVTATFYADTSLLQAGKNVIAVEVHNQRADSSDIWFDMPSVAMQEYFIMNVGADETQRNFNWYFPSAQGEVQYALRNGNTFPASYSTVTAASTAYADTYIHKATIKDLAPNSEYVYRIVNGDAVSKSFYFKTSATDSYSFVYVGDPQIGASWGGKDDTSLWETTLKTMRDLAPNANLLVSAGDQIEVCTYEKNYQGFMASPYLSYYAVATSVGNHENDYYLGASEYDASFYNKHYNLPNTSINGTTYGISTTGSDYWYTYNSTLFMHINANSANMAEHKAFMQAAIAANPNAKWKIAVMHQSMFGAGSYYINDFIAGKREVFAPLYEELDIDVVLSGHEHIYARSYMIEDGFTPYTAEGIQSTVTDPVGILYFTASSSTGTKYYDMMDDANTPHIAVKEQHVTTFTKVDVTDTSFKLTTYRVEDKSVLDSFEIIKTGAEVKPRPDYDIESNVAYGKSYTTSLLYRDGGRENNWQYDANAEIKYPDENNKTLTDGKLPKTKSYRDAAWAGLHDGTPDISAAGKNYSWVKVDLEGTHTLNKIVAFVAPDLGDGVTTPSSATVVGYDNNGNAFNIGKFTIPTNIGTDDTYVKLELSVDNIVADAIEIRLTRGGYTLISEIAAYGTAGGSYHTCAGTGDWQSNATQHWKNCSCGEKTDVKNHDNGEWSVKTPAQVGVKGEKERRCTVCNYLLETADIAPLQPDHSCSPIGNGYQSDKDNHWQECSCGKQLNKNSHTAGDWVTVKEAEIGIEGKAEKRCTVCNYLIDEKVIPALTDDEVPNFIIGDVNGNGKIDARDYLLLKRAYFGTYTLTCADEVADINGNGKLDARDYLLLKRAYFGTYTIK